MRLLIMMVTWVFMGTCTVAVAAHNPEHPPPGNAGAGNPTLGGLNCTTDQIAKFDGTKWACAEDETGGGSAAGWVLLDGDTPQKPIGEVTKVNLFSSFAEVAIPIGNQVAQLTVYSSEIEGNTPLWFKSTDCSGITYARTPYLDGTFSNAEFIFLPIANGTPEDITSRPILSAAGPEEFFIALSIWTQSGRCISFSNDSSFTPVSFGENLHMTYPQPYYLEYNQ